MIKDMTKQFATTDKTDKLEKDIEEMKTKIKCLEEKAEFNDDLVQELQTDVENIKLNMDIAEAKAAWKSNHKSYNANFQRARKKIKIKNSMIQLKN